MLTPIQVKRNKAFIAALRSGEYKQTTGTLRAGATGKYRYCCLGVACEVKRLETGLGKWVGSKFDKTKNYPPEDVYSTYYGWPDENPILKAPILEATGEDYQAAVLNDEHHFDFEGIADAFERWLKNTPKRKPATQKAARKKTSL